MHLCTCYNVCLVQFQMKSTVSIVIVKKEQSEYKAAVYYSSFFFLYVVQEPADFSNRSSSDQPLLCPLIVKLFLHSFTGLCLQSRDKDRWVWFSSRTFPLPVSRWKFCLCCIGDLCPHQPNSMELEKEHHLHHHFISALLG